MATKETTTRRRRTAKTRDEVKAPAPEQVEHIALDLCDFSPYQPRATLDDDVVRERAQSIKEVGLLVNLTGRRVEGRVQIADGAYRFAAFCLLVKEDPKYSHIPIRLQEYSDLEMALTGLEANRQRKNLSTLEEARALKRILDEFEEMKPVRLAESVGLSRSALNHYIHTLDLPAPVLVMAEEMGMTLSAMRELRRLMGREHTHEKSMIDVLKKMQERKSVTVETLEDVWKSIFLYGHIRGNFPGEWRSLNEDSYPRPVFDLEAFKSEHGEFVHVFPKVGAFTCQATVWDSLQEEAKEEEEKRRQEVAPAVSITEVATEVLPEIARPGPAEDAQVAELQEAEREADVEDGDDEEEPFESVQTETVAEPEEGELRIPLRELIPEESKGPDAGAEILPEGFELEVQQWDLEVLREMLAEGKDLAEIISRRPDLVKVALGSRAKVYTLDGLPHNAYYPLEQYNLDKLQRPKECLTQCTWGFAIAEGYGPSKDGVAMTRRVCLNKACFSVKQKALTQSRNKRGRTGLEKEQEVVEQAARGMVENGTVNLGRGECLLLLHTLTDGSSYEGSKQFYWWEPLLPHLGIQGKGVKTEIREEGWKALQDRPVEELRYFVGLMMLERVRSHAKPTEWKPSLNRWLKLLDAPHLETGSGVDMAEPATA